MLNASLTVWPSTRGLFDEIGVPLVLDFRPVDVDPNLAIIDNSIARSCPTCHAFVTIVFTSLRCPFCGSAISSLSNVPIAPDFAIDRDLPTSHSDIFFLLDLTSTFEHILDLKSFLSTALRAVFPGRPFGLCFLEHGFVSFIKVFQMRVKIVNFPLDMALSDLVSIDSLMLHSSSVDSVLELVNDIRPTRRFLEPHEMPDLSLLFSKIQFPRLLIFSSNSASTALPFIVDWISPIESSSQSDGFFLCPTALPDFAFQLQTLVQRIHNSVVDLNLQIRVFSPSNFEARPLNVSRPFARSGFSQLITISFPRSFGSFKSVPLELVATFTVMINSERFVQRTLVVSRLFETSRELVPILRTCDPMLALRVLPRERQKDFVRNLIGVYNGGILASLPGQQRFDPFFRALPNLQPVLAFLVVTGFASRISFWGSPTEKIGEFGVFPVPEIDCPIAVLDTGNAIKVFADTFSLPPGSELERAIAEMMSQRYPVPHFEWHERTEFELMIPSQRDICDAIRAAFGQKK
jgi:hypothetical protein